MEPTWPSSETYISCFHLLPGRGTALAAGWESPAKSVPSGKVGGPGKGLVSWRPPGLSDSHYHSFGKRFADKAQPFRFTWRPGSVPAPTWQRFFFGKSFTFSPGSWGGVPCRLRMWGLPPQGCSGRCEGPGSFHKHVARKALGRGTFWFKEI